jgi:predicted RNA-binding Zn-ribbon protein involved in translation (DUF1610 family)
VSSPAIKSQPVYSPLQWDASAAWHLLAAEGEGCVRLLELLATAPKTGVKVLAVTPDAGLAGKLSKLGQVLADSEALQAALRDELSQSKMGLRLYLAGTDAFLWQSAREARGFGMSTDEMHLERCGSLERPVYCTHCTHVTQGVKTNLVVCPKCQRTLFVRDHFSRHHAAYMGFQIDAEVPGVIPPVEEAYP